MIPQDVRLYTWVDVEDVLLHAQHAGHWPAWLVWARIYWDTATFGIRPGTEPTAIEWFQKYFDPRFDVERPGILLEELAGAPRVLPIVFDETDERAGQQVYLPTFARPSVLQAPGEIRRPAALDEDLPPVILFHSFKGGVGRTLHALGLGVALSQEEGVRTLLIDGDLEAPGLTWLIRKRFPNPPISYADFLALVHSDGDPTAAESIALSVDRLRALEFGSTFLLPAFRSEAQFQSLEIRPEHLIRGSDDPFRLTSLLARLGRELGVDAVIVDGRAGLSEMSAGLLLDPRVYRVLVGTPTGQSLAGTMQLLELMGRISPSVAPEDPTPAVIINQVPETYSKEQREELTATVLSAGECFLVGDDPDLPVLLSPFDPGLIVLPQDWDEVVSRISRSGMIPRLTTIRQWMPQLTGSAPSVAPIEGAEITEMRRQLSEFASNLVFAESGGTSEFLNIQPLQNLASHSTSTAPIAVVIGAKGAGKTYTYLQIARRQTWREFARDAGGASSLVDAAICPVLSAKNLQEAARDVVHSAREAAAGKIGGGAPAEMHQITDYIRDGLRSTLHEGEWRERWLNVIAWACGVEVGSETAGRSLVAILRNESRSVVALFDGLEDLFQELSSHDAEQVALRALIQELPDWLEQIPLRPLGLVVVVRQDMVLAAVRQNPAQLSALYEPFALKWGSVEALRLVLWTCLKAGVLSGDVELVPEIEEPELITRLAPLWGRKLGIERSKEARSAEWVIAALSDLNGQIQARDLTRFLATAARASVSDTRWHDRILTPQAVRTSVDTCGKEKVREIKQESAILAHIFGRLEEVPEEKRIVPFTPDAVGLTVSEVKALEENGIVAREGYDYYLAEIFRQGLGYRLRAGARPRVLTLARRARSA